jgi:hypothetical protein
LSAFLGWELYRQKFKKKKEFNLFDFNNKCLFTKLSFMFEGGEIIKSEKKIYIVEIILTNFLLFSSIWKNATISKIYLYFEKIMVVEPLSLPVLQSSSSTLGHSFLFILTTVPLSSILSSYFYTFCSWMCACVLPSAIALQPWSLLAPNLYT